MNLEELRKRLKEINAELDALLEQLDGDDGEGGDDGERMTGRNRCLKQRTGRGSQKHPGENPI